MLEWTAISRPWEIFITPRWRNFNLVHPQMNVFSEHKYAEHEEFISFIFLSALICRSERQGPSRFNQNCLPNLGRMQRWQSKRAESLRTVPLPLFLKCWFESQSWQRAGKVESVTKIFPNFWALRNKSAWDISLTGSKSSRVCHHQVVYIPS